MVVDTGKSHRESLPFGFGIGRHPKFTDYKQRKPFHEESSEWNSLGVPNFLRKCSSHKSKEHFHQPEVAGRINGLAVNVRVEKEAKRRSGNACGPLPPGSAGLRRRGRPGKVLGRSGKPSASRPGSLRRNTTASLLTLC